MFPVRVWPVIIHEQVSLLQTNISSICLINCQLNCTSNVCLNTMCFFSFCVGILFEDSVSSGQVIIKYFEHPGNLCGSNTL